MKTREETLKEFGFNRTNTRWYVIVGKDENSFRYVYLSSSTSPSRADKFARKYARKHGIKLIQSTIYPSQKEAVIPVQLRGIPEQYVALEKYTLGDIPKSVECYDCKKKTKIENAYALVKPFKGTEWRCHLCTWKLFNAKEKLKEKIEEEKERKKILGKKPTTRG